MIKAVIFDYGGVMKSSHPLSMDIATIYNISVEEVEKVKKITIPFFSLLQRGLINEQEFWQKFSDAIKKPIPQNYKELLREIYEKTLVLFPEMIEFVKKLKDKGIKTAVLSNITKFQAEIIRKNNGYKEFDVLVLSYEEKLEKPELNIYLSVIKKLGVEPEECVFIDDKEKNLAPAKSLGMKTVLAKNSGQIIKDVFSIINLPNRFERRPAGGAD